MVNIVRGIGLGICIKEALLGTQVSRNLLDRYVTPDEMTVIRPPYLFPLFVVLHSKTSSKKFSFERTAQPINSSTNTLTMHPTSWPLNHPFPQAGPKKPQVF